MIDHITIGVGDYARSKAFYGAALAPLGIQALYVVPHEHTHGVDVCGFGDDRPWFWIAGQDGLSGKFHVAFTAQTRAQVDAFHAAALAAGGTDNGPPGPRPHYDLNYYGAFVLDPDGFNIEAVCRAPA
jgi:catechol 2,3-dioxygenase-like lactoylglutathione lyase family enzyme